MKIIAVGSAMVDIIVSVAAHNVERMTMHNATSSFLLLEQGRKVEAEKISEHIGGGAVNAAVGMARLGHALDVVIKIGDDRNGQQIRDRLAQEGIQHDYVKLALGTPTGVAVMVSSHDRNATIFTQRGANGHMQPQDIATDFGGGYQLCYITALSNQSADCFPIFVDRAANNGCFVAVNPGIRQLTSRPHILLDRLHHIDLLAINRVEAEALVPMVCGRYPQRKNWPGESETPAPRLLRLGLSFGGFDLSLGEFWYRLREAGLRRLVVTDGTDGAYFADSSGIRHCPVAPANVQGTAGAGDAFTSTLASLVAEGIDVDTALNWAAHNAASVVSEIDTQQGLLLRRELAQQAAEHPLAVRLYNAGGAMTRRSAPNVEAVIGDG